MTRPFTHRLLVDISRLKAGTLLRLVVPRGPEGCLPFHDPSESSTDAPWWLDPEQVEPLATAFTPTHRIRGCGAEVRVISPPKAPGGSCLCRDAKGSDFFTLPANLEPLVPFVPTHKLITSTPALSKGLLLRRIEGSADSCGLLSFRDGEGDIWWVPAASVEPLAEPRRWNRSGEYATESHFGPFIIRVELVTLESPKWEGGKRGMHTAVIDAEWKLTIPGHIVASGYIDTREMEEAQTAAVAAVQNWLKKLEETL